MTRTFIYNGTIDLALQSPVTSFRFAECAYRGQVGTGGFDFEDAGATVTLVGHVDFWANESESSPVRFFTGRFAARGIGRGAALRTGSAKQWQSGVVDVNTLFDDILLRNADANRPAETDVARMTWLLTSGALPSVGDNFLSGSNTSSMAAQDYRGRHARDVADECAEQAGKNYYLIADGSTIELSYDIPTTTARQATGAISSVLAEVHPDPLTATVFGPSWGSDSALARDPGRRYSGVQVDWEGGSVFVENLTTKAIRQREIAIYNSAAKTAAQATIIANQFLEAAATEEDTLTCPLVLPASKLGLYLVGQTVETNFPHLGGARTYFISKRTIGPWEGVADRYLVILSLAEPVKITRFRGRAPEPPGGGAAEPPVACGITDSFNRADGSGPSDSGLVWFVNAGSPGVISNELELPPNSSYLLTFDAPMANPFYARWEFECPVGVTDVAMTVGCLSIEFVVGVPGVTFSVRVSGSPASMSFTVQAGRRYMARVEATIGILGRLQMWEKADLEPTGWGILHINGAGSANSFAEFNNGGGSVSMFVDNLDITGLNRCTQEDSDIAYQGAMYGPVLIATADGVTSIFTLPAYPGGGYVPGTLSVYVDGMWQPVTQTDPAAGTFDLVVDPDAGDVIYAGWRVPP